MGKNFYPPDDKIIAGLTRLGSRAAYARELGVSRSAFTDELTTRGLQARCDEAVREYKRSARPAAHLPGYPPADEIVAGVRRLGTRAAYARELGVTPNRFREHVQRTGLTPRCDVAAREFMQERRLAVAGVTADGTPDISELDMLRQENNELRKVTGRIATGNVLEERILHRLEQAVQTATPRYSPLVIAKRSRKDEHEFALLFSDTHASEVVSAESTLGMNAYDWGIMLARMARIQRSVLSYQANRPYPIRKLHVWMLGDLLSGEIHEDLARTNDRSREEATVQFGADAATWLEEFVPHFEKIEVTGVPGNHPRNDKKPTPKRPMNNADWTAMQFMRCYHRGNKAFNWNLPLAEFATTTVAERWRVLLMHGDGIRSTMPGVPWGGVVRRITTLEQQFAKAKQWLDYVALGHFHTANGLDGVGVKTFLNGSLKGVDEYSLKQFGSGRPPTQLLLTFHPKRGVTDMSWLDPEVVVPAAEPALPQAA